MQRKLYVLLGMEVSPLFGHLGDDLPMKIVDSNAAIMSVCKLSMSSRAEPNRSSAMLYAPLIVDERRKEKE